MTRSTKALFAGIAAATLAACATPAPEEPLAVGVARPEPEQAAPEEEDPTESDDAGDDDGERRSGPDAGEEERTDRTGRNDRNSDGGTPWHLLPEEDRPGPVEQPECRPARASPVAC
jgi:hypothetical protein